MKLYAQLKNGNTCLQTCSLSGFPNTLLKLLLSDRDFHRVIERQRRACVRITEDIPLVFLSFVETWQGKVIAGGASFCVSEPSAKHRLSCAAESIPPTTWRIPVREEGECN